MRATLPSSMVVDVELERKVPAVMADPVQAEQVLLNLLHQCARRDERDGHRRGERRGSRSTRAGRAGRAASRSGADSLRSPCAIPGAGIEPEVLDRIFEPFFTTKGVGKGCGMGLSTVHGIVHEYGGHVTVDSAPGAGATFRVLLPPLADARADPGTATFGPALHAPRGAADVRPRARRRRRGDGR